MPDPDGELYALAKSIKVKSAQLEALEGAVEAEKAELRQRTTLPYFEINQGKGTVPSSVSIPTTEGEVLVTFTSRYKKVEDDSDVVRAFGDEFAAAHFKQSFTITIAGDQLSTADPSNPERNPAQEFIDELQELIARHRADDAVTYKQEVKPTKEFHENRHCLLTPERNVQLQDICPMVISVKTKGRDGE